MKSSVMAERAAFQSLALYASIGALAVLMSCCGDVAVDDAGMGDSFSGWMLNLSARTGGVDAPTGRPAGGRLSAVVTWVGATRKGSHDGGRSPGVRARVDRGL